MVTQKKKDRLVKNIESWGEIFTALFKTIKPFALAIGTLSYNLILVWMLYKERMEVSDFIAAVGPMNMAIIGFWFNSKKNETKEETKEPESATKPDVPEEESK